MATNNEQELQKWMEEVAERKKPRKKLIFDKKTKRLIAVSATDLRADRSLEFTPQEATRFSA
ncbi:hypothetical protein QUF90_17050 [Desulfococcaceae bacterium HSG9]|nr:hypothetical protein [Desulfococcaceae bacterium HSG9]